jgi:hypothetical protein
MLNNNKHRQHYLPFVKKCYFRPFVSNLLKPFFTYYLFILQNLLHLKVVAKSLFSQKPQHLTVGEGGEAIYIL